MEVLHQYRIAVHHREALSNDEVRNPQGAKRITHGNGPHAIREDLRNQQPGSRLQDIPNTKINPTKPTTGRYPFASLIKAHEVNNRKAAQPNAPSAATGFVRRGQRPPAQCSLQPIVRGQGKYSERGNPVCFR